MILAEPNQDREARGCPQGSTHPVPHANSAQGRWNQKRILLAEDNSEEREQLSEVLASEHFHVLRAECGSQAIALAASNHVDLVILDLNTRADNGWDTFATLNTERPLVPIIVLTAQPNQLFTAVNAGAGALIEKPLDIPGLIQTIQRLLAEPTSVRMGRLIGRPTEFFYQAGKDSHILPKTMD